MSRVVLIIVGIVALLMGILGAIPSIEMASEPMWHAIVKIVVGVLAIIIAAADKPKTMGGE